MLSLSLSCHRAVTATAPVCSWSWFSFSSWVLTQFLCIFSVRQESEIHPRRRRKRHTSCEIVNTPRLATPATRAAPPVATGKACYIIATIHPAICSWSVKQSWQCRRQCPHAGYPATASGSPAAITTRVVCPIIITAAVIAVRSWLWGLELQPLVYSTASGGSSISTRTIALIILGRNGLQRRKDSKSEPAQWISGLPLSLIFPARSALHSHA